MAVHSLYLLLALILSHNVVALQVTPNSPCSSVCLDSSTLDESDPNSSNTESTDIVCEDTDLTNTSTGSKWKQCMTCLQTSTFEQGSESDQYWFIYNLRYSFDHCVYGFPNGTGSGSNPCETSTACGALKTALEDGDLSTTGSQFGYCDDGAVTGEFYSACLTCVGSSGDTRYIANALVALEAGCLQRPNVTSTLGLNDTVFSAAIIGIVDPSKKDESTDSVQLSTAAIAGIAIGAAALLLVIAAIIFIRMRRRKNRANLGIEPRWGRSKKSHKRNSSFSFHCRKILASPMSPKFFRDDLTPVEEEQQQYGSLNGMAQSQVSGVIPASTDPTGRRFIESKQKPSRPAYEQVWSPQDPPPSFNTFGAPVMTPEQPDRQPAPSFSEKKGFPEKGSLSIDTTLVAPPPARQSPKQDVFAALIASSQPIPPGLPFRSSHAPSSHGSIVSATSPQSAGGGNKLRTKPSTTTMSSQGSGYPSMMTPCSASPLLKQKHGWPSPREAAEVPWFPPPPPGPPPKSSALKSGRKGAGGSGRKRNRDSGSPVETHQIQISFPAPPQR